MANIFEIEAELVQIAEAYDALDGQDESPEVLSIVEAYFEELLQNRDRKVDGYCRLIADYQAKAKARKAEADRLAALAKADDAAADRLKSRLKAFMEEAGMTRLEGLLHKVSIQANGGKLPLVLEPGVEDNAALLPEWAQRVEIKVDRDEIRRRLDEAEPLDFARLGERGTQVRIR